MIFCLNGGALTPKERNALIRYCISVATRGRCSTKALLRPFKQKYLKEAFAEQSKVHTERIARYERAAQAYDPQTAGAPHSIPGDSGSVPAKEAYIAHCREIVRQERDTVRSLRRLYTVCVNYAFVGKKWLAFHRSLNPRVTFGSSSLLHEECDFLFDDEKRAAFLSSSLADLPQWKGDTVHDWGNVMFGNMQLLYEDLALYRGDVCILETVSHEEMMTARLDDADLTALARTKGGKILVKKIKTLQK